jgi:hypothetical protein
MLELLPMPVAVALFLTLLYAVFSPLGARVRAAEQRALASALPGVPSSSAVAGARSFLDRGWTSFVASELWLLLLLAGIIALFHTWWLAFALPAGGVLLRFLLHAVDPYPSRLAWYLGRFRVQVERARERAVAEGDAERAERAEALSSALTRLADEEGDEPVL